MLPYDGEIVEKRNLEYNNLKLKIMRLDGRRSSSNVEDRRGLSGGKVAGIGGIGAVIIAALFAWISGGDPVSAGLQAFQQQM